ncbi:hypothetical protein [Sphingomonas hankookensis]
MICWRDGIDRIWSSLSDSGRATSPSIATRQSAKRFATWAL